MTPSTSCPISSPKSSITSSSDALVSSTVSCSSAAQRVAVSSRMPAQIFATPIGCTMKSSPLARRWSAGARTRRRTRARRARGRSPRPTRRVLLHDREQVAQEDALVVRQAGLGARGGVLVVAVDRAVPKSRSVALDFALAPRAPFERVGAAFFLVAAAVPPCVPLLRRAALGRGGGKARRGLLGPLLRRGLICAARQPRHMTEFRAAPRRLARRRPPPCGGRGRQPRAGLAERAHQRLDRPGAELAGRRLLRRPPLPRTNA